MSQEKKKNLSFGDLISVPFLFLISFSFLFFCLVFLKQGSSVALTALELCTRLASSLELHLHLPPECEINAHPPLISYLRICLSDYSGIDTLILTKPNVFILG